MKKRHVLHKTLPFKPLNLSHTAENHFVIFGSSDNSLNDRALVKHIRENSTHTPIIMIAGDMTDKQRAAALDIGLSDCVGIPVSLDHMVSHFNQTPRKGAAVPVRVPFIVGDSPAIKDIKEKLSAIAATDCNVLITGETGTGKDLAAEYIHLMSHRKERPLVSINCTAFPESLLESELFGHEKGAFTNAVSKDLGKFESASGSSLFLDEIGDMDKCAQAKILRAIDKKEIWRIGGDHPRQSDFRLITATNRDLEDLVERGLFREDLYYRLNIARVHIPPIRDRKEDIPALAHYARHVFNQKYHCHVYDISDDVLELFMNFDWPGNIRQLNNVIEASFIHSPNEVLSPADLPDMFFSGALTYPSGPGKSGVQ